MPTSWSRGEGNDKDKGPPRRPKLGRSSIITPPSFLLCTLLTLLWGITAIDSLYMPPLPIRLKPSHKTNVANRATSGSALAEPQSDSARVDVFSIDVQSRLTLSNIFDPTVHEHSVPEGSSENSNVELFYSENQLKSIQSDAPAILLKSGPGTGKTYALASRIAHLIRSGECPPEQMVVLSFTNRDAHTLKDKAVDMLVREESDNKMSRKEITDRLWSGTIHAFASSIIRTYSRRKFRVVNSKEIRARADKCLRILLEEKHYRREGNLSKLESIRILHRDALSDVRQSRGTALHQICRCIELWKEAGMLPPPVVNNHPRKTRSLADPIVRDNCVELSMRLGISQNVAQLALELYPQYQSLHEAHATADPSDLAGIASHILCSNTKALNAFRTKLKHIILDEYQDVSVTQHSLIRLIVRGVIDETDEYGSLDGLMVTLPPVLDSPKPTSTSENTDICFQVPNLFCGGDLNQSIYGWRGAVPFLSIEGFRRDYPQGIVVPLDTSFRLPRNIWNTVNLLVDPDKDDRRKVKTFSTSPVTRILHKSGDSDETLQVLFSKASKDDDWISAIRIQGLWDAREEAKYIGSSIRKRCKARMKRFAAAFDDLALLSQGTVQTMRDPTDVAIMVRSGNHMELIKECLAKEGIPFVVCESEADVASSTKMQVDSNLKLMDMKPVVLMTMHRAKGEEFDDVYLAGWTEGIFPHPTAVSTNRVDEERRLAFVAITRARQQVVVTHSFISRVLHNGPDLMSKYVTTQVSASRFLYELVPAARTSSADTVHNAMTTQSKLSKGLPTVVWNRGRGVKEFVAGRDVPEYFVKSYIAESTFSPVHSLNGSHTITHKNVHNVTIGGSQSTTLVDVAPNNGQEPSTVPSFAHLTASDMQLLSTVKTGLHEMCEQKIRSKGKFKIVFREVLRDRFNLHRGSALVLPQEKEPNTKGRKVSYDALLNIPRDQLGRRPLSQCTAVELGLYVAYCLLSPFTKSN